MRESTLDDLILNLYAWYTRSAISTQASGLWQALRDLHVTTDLGYTLTTRPASSWLLRALASPLMFIQKQNRTMNKTKSDNHHCIRMVTRIPFIQLDSIDLLCHSAFHKHSVLLSWSHLLWCCGMPWGLYSIRMLLSLLSSGKLLTHYFNIWQELNRCLVAQWNRRSIVETSFSLRRPPTNGLPPAISPYIRFQLGLLQLSTASSRSTMSCPESEWHIHVLSVCVIVELSVASGISLRHPSARRNFCWRRETTI